MKLKPGFLVALALWLSPAAVAVVINDGSSVNNLTRLLNENGRDDADTAIVVTGAELQASQSGGTLTQFPVRTAWYASGSFATGGVYSVSADFRPAEATLEHRGGVIGWLDISAGVSRGISFHVRPPGQTPTFQVSVIDFKAATDAENESLVGLFNLDGTPATDDLASAAAAWETNYVAASNAVFQLEFIAPTPADTNVVSNATARVAARVFQGVDTGGAPIPASRRIELLTTLPVPTSTSHRFGYFGLWASIFAPGDVIGYFDNLSGSGVDQIPNVPPTVAISSPAPGATYTEPASVSITAGAQDTNGIVVRVEFFAGTNSLGTATNEPFALTWNGVAAGNYSLTARATDDRGATTTSEPVSITVNTGSGTGPQMAFAVVGNSLEISWSGTGYELQMKGDLNATTWVPVEPSTVNTNRATVPLSSAGGFFRLVRVGAPTGPQLSIQQSGNLMVISWPAQVTGYRLQARPDAGSGAWMDLNATNNQFSEPAGGPTRFYRLINP